MVHQLLTNYLEHLSLHPEFTQAEVAHFFLPQDNVIYSYVVVDPESKEITDFFSFYSLPSSVLMSAKYPTLNAAYAFYVVPNRFPLVAIFKDMLILAKKHGFDVFNTLDLMENATIFGDLRFGQGDGNLQYYLYNWSCKSMTQEKVGLILV
jgi:glycylpeptide N-tetradecanoyltransferase